MEATNAAGPAELAPQPAPGLAFDRRGALRDMVEVLRERGADLTSHPAANGTIADTEYAGELLTAAGAEVHRLRESLEEALFVLGMVHKNNRIAAGSTGKAWSGRFVAEEVQRVVERKPLPRSMTA